MEDLRIMAIKDNLKKFEQSHPLAIYGILVAVILGWPAYYNFLADSHPQLYVDILSDISVLEIREELPKLEIRYDGINIREQDLSLRIYNLSVVNDSTIDIRIQDYDPKDPIGLTITEGKIISAEVTGASNDYLKSNLTLAKEGDQNLKIFNIIIDGGQGFDLKLLVLHPENKVPKIEARGHIAGMDKIPVQRFEDRAPRPIKDWITLGFKWMLITIGGLFAVLLLIVVPISLLIDRIKVNRLINKYRKAYGTITKIKGEYILRQYKKHGSLKISILHTLLHDSELIDRAMKRYLKWLKEEPEAEEEMIFDFKDDDNKVNISSSILQSIFENKLVLDEDDKWVSDPDALKILDEFTEFLISEKKFQKHSSDFPL